MKSPFLTRLALAFLSGATMALGFAPLRWWWLAWVALAPLYVALSPLPLTPSPSEGRGGMDARKHYLLWFPLSLRRGRGLGGGGLSLDRFAAIGCAFGLGLFLIGMYWMTEVGFFAWPVLSAIQAVPFALFGAAFAFLSGSIGGRVPVQAGEAPALRQDSFLRPITFAAVYVLLEWARTQGKYAFPWFPLAATQVETLPLLQIISITGQWGLTFAIALCSALTGEACLNARRNRKWVPRYMIAALTVFAVVAVLGRTFLFRMPDEDLGSDPRSVPVGIAQSGEASSDDFFGVYRDLSRRIREDDPEVSLILWPEGVAPPDIADNFNPREALTAFARSENVSLIIGSDAIDSKGRYTSAMLIDNRGQIAGRYDKIQLVPMGEFFLFRPLLKMVTDRYIPEEDKVAGTKPGVMDVQTWRNHRGKIGAIICYESAFPNRVRDTVRAGAQCIALITDDETFGTTAGPYQHADFSVLRAVETGRYLVRAAHTGTSRIIDPTGRVVKSLPLMKRGVLTGNIILRDDQTLYVRFGDWLVLLCGGIVAAALVLPRIVAQRS